MSSFFQQTGIRVSAWLRRPRQRGFAYWALVATIVLFCLRLLPITAKHVGAFPWIALLVWILASLPRFSRWLRWRLLWKLRNRLFVTYLLIGVTPIVLLGTLAGIAGYVLFGQFANFAAASEITPELSHLAANDQVLALHFQQQLRAGSGRLALPSQLAFAPEEYGILAVPELRVGVYLDGRLQAVALPAGHALTDVPTPPAWLPQKFDGLVLAGDQLYFRAISREPVENHVVSVILSLPLDANFLARAASGLGSLTIWPDVHLRSQMTTEVHIDVVPPSTAVENRSSSATQSHQREIVGGQLTKADSIFDIPIHFPTALEARRWSTGNHISILGLITSRPSLLYRRLFRQSQRFGGHIRIALIVVGILFLALELFAIFVASRLSKTITKSVAGLYHATREVDRGRLDYRIPVVRQDQLSALSQSFNSMSASLGRLLQEQKEKERMQGELAIAQEVQSNLFPASDVRIGGLELHGLCRPARTVSGDYYDFLVLGGDALCLAIGDISGKGISAALLMAALHSAVRAYSFAGEELFQDHPLESLHDRNGDTISAAVFRSPGSLLRLLNRHLFRSIQPEKYATLFLAHYDATTSVLRYANGGQLPPLLLRPDGSVLRLDRGGSVVGLLDNVDYEEGAVMLQPGDLLIAYSDGVTEPENELGDFGEARLVELVRGHRHLPLEEISARVVEAIGDWIGAQEQPDDITLVLARQH